MLLPGLSRFDYQHAQGAQQPAERDEGRTAAEEEGAEVTAMHVYRRGKGKRAKYSYRFRWTMKNADGTSETFEIRKSARASSRKAAEEAAEAHRRALRLGLVHPRDPWPPAAAQEAPDIRQFAKRFLEYAETSTGPGTARFYRECLERVLAFPPLADMRLPDVTGEQVTKYLNWRLSRPAGNSVATVNGELRTLRRLFNLAEEWGEIPKAPAIHELPGDTGRHRVLTFAEEAAYLRAASPTLRDAATLAVDTGLRPKCELFPLEWGNVHLERTADAPSGYIHVAAGKTINAVRNVPLTARARGTLEMRRPASNGSRYVFPGPGRSGHLTSIEHPHQGAIRKAELPNNRKLEPFEFYCWRHTFGTRCAESGMDKFSLARLMGHSSPRVAERYYIHVTEPHVTAGFGRFADYLAKNQVDAFPLLTDRPQ